MIHVDPYPSGVVDFVSRSIYFAVLYVVEELFWSVVPNGHKLSVSHSSRGFFSFGSEISGI